MYQIFLNLIQIAHPPYPSPSLRASCLAVACTLVQRCPHCCPTTLHCRWHSRIHWGPNHPRHALCVPTRLRVGYWANCIHARGGAFSSSSVRGSVCFQSIRGSRHSSLQTLSCSGTRLRSLCLWTVRLSFLNCRPSTGISSIQKGTTVNYFYFQFCSKTPLDHTTTHTERLWRHLSSDFVQTLFCTRWSLVISTPCNNDFELTLCNTNLISYWSSKSTALDTHSS